MKPGQLERSLSRLSQVARAARERLTKVERELDELRRQVEAGPVAPRGSQDLVKPQGSSRPGRADGEDRERPEAQPEPARSRSRQAAAPGPAQGKVVFE